jgi:hypothetical protein
MASEVTEINMRIEALQFRGVVERLEEAGVGDPGEMAKEFPKQTEQI